MRPGTANRRCAVATSVSRNRRARGTFAALVDGPHVAPAVIAQGARDFREPAEITATGWPAERL